ncbi:hypothetical protein ACIBL5_38730 [Streptomyces sp. NPDC050516]|uniref:hypothetical protein n=1 Tax=Streptomyces sp. NPDC050516 TaxID=3365621 RepID=UPI0037A7E9CF
MPARDRVGVDQQPQLPQDLAGQRREEHREKGPVLACECDLLAAELALLASFTVATIDQAFMAVQPVRYGALRLLGLSGRTVVIR